MKPKGTIQLNKLLRAFSVKVVLLGVALLLLLSSVVYLTAAWYTKMVSVSGMQFHAAEWDFTANFAIDELQINVYEYTTLSGTGRAAPGTRGEIPLQLGAWQSDTDVEYTISIDRGLMSEEFKKRIFFYYEDATGNKVYFDGSPEDLLKEDQTTQPEKQLLTGVIDISQNTQKTVIIYWEWIYELPKPKEESEMTEEELNQWKEKSLVWDEFDTKVGMDPELYTQYMNAKISIMGVEVKPEKAS